jgi:hypothetical protein
MREAKELLAHRAELADSDGPEATAEVRGTWQRLDELARQAEEKFPLSDSAVRDLRVDLQRRVLALHATEVDAHEAMAAVMAH